MNLFILAAGVGSRLRPHTLKLPKPAIPFLNVPMAYYALANAKCLSPARTVVNTFYMPEKIHALFSKENMNKIDWDNFVQFSDEGEKIRGSGGALAFARTNFSKTISIHHDTLLVNADEITFPKDKDVFMKAYLHHLKEQNLATLLTCPHPEAGKKFGAVWVHKANRVVGFGKNSPEPGCMPMHYLGAVFLAPKIFEYLKYEGEESNILYDDLMLAMADGEKVQSYNIDCEWHETGNPEDYLKATEHFMGLYESSYNLQNLVKTYSLKEQEFLKGAEAQILKSKNVTLDDSMKFKGFAVLNQAPLKNSLIENSVLISASSDLKIQNRIIL